MTQTVTSGRRRASGDRAHRPHAGPPPDSPTRRGLRGQQRAGPGTTARRLHDSAPTAGIVLASAGLLLAAVAPPATTVAAVPADATPASGAAPAVTASLGTPVSFGPERAGRAAEGPTPSVVSAPAPSTPPAPAAMGPEPFAVPVEDPVVSSAFGYRVDPLGGYAAELHTGLDYAGACGTTVTAAAAGTVVESGWHAYGGGRRIVIDHGDGLKTTYNHLSVLGVPAGTDLQRGEPVGAVGSTGNSTGCHLHFEVLVDDEKVDPQPWL